MDESFLKHPLNLAHLEDRKAEDFLSKEDYEQSILCHQRAHRSLRQVLMSQSPAQHKTIDHVFLTSLYSQLEYHIRQQSVILNKQKRAITILKRQPYVASIRERATEALLTQQIQEQLTQHSSLLESLKEKIHNEETILDTTQNTELSPEGRFKKPKDHRDTIEELSKVNEQLRHLVDELVTENITLRKERDSLQENTMLKIQENTFSCESESSVHSHHSDSGGEGPIYSLPKALAKLPPLEQPTFHVDEIPFEEEDVDIA